MGVDGVTVSEQMNEQVRMHYLEAMGIDMFVPRWVLPGAKPSRSAPLPVAESELATGSGVHPVVAEEAGSDGVASSHKPPSSTERAPAASGLVSSLMAQLGGTNAKTFQNESVGALVESAPDASVRETEAAVRFTLNIWPMNAHLLVLDSHRPRQGLPTARLLNNILFAKGVSAPTSPPESLMWPVAAGLAGPTGWSAAREMVGEFLENRLKARPVTYLWLMGEEAFRAVAPESASYTEKLGQALDLPRYGVVALVLPSLSDMLTTPSLKACTWATIAPYQVQGD